MSSLRIVLDTNTLVSALLFRRDAWSWLRSAWKDGLIVPVFCTSTALELVRVLAYPKFKLTRLEQDSFLQEILPFCVTRSNPKSYMEIVSCRDPKDQVFLELALEARVDYLVSGDRDLLAFPPTDGIRVIAPASLRELLSPEC